MHHFNYKGDELYVEDVAVKSIVAKVGSPVYIYSLATLERHFKAMDDAFAAIPHTICYSVKANSNLAVLKTFINLGGGWTSSPEVSYSGRSKLESIRGR